MDQRLKRLTEELGEAINESLTESERISEVIAKINAGGYDVSLLLNATIGFRKREEEPVSQATGKFESRFNPQDIKFLKSLHISVDK